MVHDCLLSHISTVDLQASVGGVSSQHTGLHSEQDEVIWYDMAWTLAKHSFVHMIHVHDGHCQCEFILGWDEQVELVKLRPAQIVHKSMSQDFRRSEIKSGTAKTIRMQ